MAVIRKSIDVREKLTEDQLKMLKEAREKPYVFDEDNPLLAREELIRFHRVSEEIKEERAKKCRQNVTLRLSPKTISKAKSLGKGYTSILAGIIEKVFENPSIMEMLMK